MSTAYTVWGGAGPAGIYRDAAGFVQEGPSQRLGIRILGMGLPAPNRSIPESIDYLLPDWMNREIFGPGYRNA